MIKPFTASMHSPLVAGAQLWMLPNARRRCVALALMLPIGAASAPHPGLAALLARTINRPMPGTVAWDATVGLEQIGSELFAAATWPSLNCTIQVLPEHLPTALALLGPRLAIARLDTATYQRRSAELSAEIEAMLVAPDRLAQLGLARLLGQPALAATASALSGGSTLAAIRPDDLHSYAAGNSTHGLHLIVAGGFDPEQLQAQCQQIFATWPQQPVAACQPFWHYPATVSRLWINHPGPLLSITLGLDLATGTEQPIGWAAILALLLEDQLLQRLRQHDALSYAINCQALGTTLIAQIEVEAAQAQRAWASIETTLEQFNPTADPSAVRQAAQRAITAEVLALEYTSSIANRCVQLIASPPAGLSDPLLAWQQHWDWLAAIAQGATAMPPAPDPAQWRWVAVGPATQRAANAANWMLVSGNALL